jgi:ABC-type bacteriocin/lantibiotic exporter with double-glycine peptidase domain
MEAVPEDPGHKRQIRSLSGAIEISNLSFRYGERMPLILDNLSLKIRQREYVAIVGKTGCGKSTLLRLLLGFETPLLGSVYYDGKDLRELDVQSIRRRIGVVMQNGKLLQGNIYENIALNVPGLSLEGAWEAAEAAGIADDIRAMPMGIFTIAGEGGGGFSGGQKQRILIARALASKPRILFFDEATAALDNLTQGHVAETLDHLTATRVLIAHRLSTIRRCDRIVVLDQGRIGEEGTYEDLITRGGIFAELAARQRVTG